jgi:hypothetical protein
MKMNKDTRNGIKEWIKEWDTNEEHDLDLCIELKDWARELFGKVLEEEGKAKKKVKPKPKKKAKQYLYPGEDGDEDE